MSNGKVVVITGDRGLVTELSPSMQSRGFELVAVPGAREAVMNLGMPELRAVVADLSRMPRADREALLQVHREKRGFPLVLLENAATLSPAEPGPLRRLPWPSPAGFIDQVRACGAPTIFFVDPAFFASRTVLNTLQQSGVQAVAFESTMGLLETVIQQIQVAEKRRQTPMPKPKSFWDKLSGEKSEAEPIAAALGNVFVVKFSGALNEAEALDGRLRQAAPRAVSYLVASGDPLVAAVKAIRDGYAASLPRESAGKIAGALEDARSGKVGETKEKERILLLDNEKDKLAPLVEALAAKGYEVTPEIDPEKAIRLAQKPGSFHLAVIGASMAYAKLGAKEIALRLREADPDLRIIFMVEPFPVETVMKRLSEVVALGVDDALLKPVEPERLMMSGERALRNRFLIIENRRLLQENEEKRAELERINGFQKKFFAMVAHDVKNPLTAILGYSEVLGMRLKEASEIKCASHIHSAAKTLNLLISDLVDLAAIESGKLRVNIASLDLNAVLNEVRSRIDVVAQQRQIKFGVEAPPEFPALAGDPGRIGQVIQNLCTNGIQYTNEGGSVTVKVALDAQWVTVSVVDTGIGIKKEDLPRVWERFFQTAEAQQMRKAGFGLGLKISREIVQMHGGDIGIESEFGKGSRFFFTLPVQKGAAVAAPAPAAAAPISTQTPPPVATAPAAAPVTPRPPAPPPQPGPPMPEITPLKPRSPT